MTIKINYCPILGCTGWEFRKTFPEYSKKKKKNNTFNEKIRNKV